MCIAQKLSPSGIKHIYFYLVCRRLAILPGGNRWCSLWWSTSAHEQPFHSGLEDTQVIPIRKHRIRQRIPLPSSSHKETWSEVLCSRWMLNFCSFSIVWCNMTKNSTTYKKHNLFVLNSRLKIIIKTYNYNM